MSLNSCTETNIFSCAICLVPKEGSPFQSHFIPCPKTRKTYLHWLDLRQLFRLYFIDGIRKYIYTYSSTFLDSLVAQTMKNLPTMQDTGFDPWVRKIHRCEGHLFPFVYSFSRTEGLFPPGSYVRRLPCSWTAHFRTRFRSGEKGGMPATISCLPGCSSRGCKVRHDLPTEQQSFIKIPVGIFLYELSRVRAVC